MHLKKGISFFGVFSIASGAMISSGIFILPGLAYSRVGPAVFISYFVAGVLGLIGILSIIELSTAMPKAGGDYYFINKTLGPLVGTISGFLGWIALSLKSAFAIFGISKVVYLYTGINPLISGFVLCLLFVIINIVGVKEAAAFQVGMVVALFALMLAYLFIGLPKMEMEFFSPFLQTDVNKIFVTSGFIFVSFGGLLKVANISEEVNNPKRNIPLGMISSIIVVTIFYTLITMVITGTLEPEVFKESLTPVADSARVIMGEVGFILIIVASTLAFFTTANAGIMAASRYPLALSLDNLLPKQIAAINRRFKTPIISILISGLIIFLSLLLPLDLLVKAASSVILTSYVLTNISVIILRESRITNYRPSFKTPFYPWMQIFSILLFSFFIVDLGLASIELSIGFVTLSLCVYFFYGRRKAGKEYALLHLMRRIADDNLLRNTLEDELRDILIHRDDIEQDNFDLLIRQAKIIDIDGHLDFETLLGIVSKDISTEVEVPHEELVRKYLKRQEESNTAISDFLAIPHIVLEGENKMFLTIVRSRDGIIFTEQEDRVKAVFLLGGTKEKKLLHLKTIAAIATLVGEQGFQQNWNEAESRTELKNLMVLSNRKRFH